MRFVAALLVLLAPQVRAASDVDPKLYQSMEWRNIGPFRGGRSNASTGVIQDPLTFYFGGVGGGVWKTDDGGTTWRNVSDGFFKWASVGALAVAPSDPNVIYAGMGETTSVRYVRETRSGEMVGTCLRRRRGRGCGRREGTTS